MKQQGKILVAFADDHKMVRKFLIEYLNKHNDIMVIAEGKDGQELLENIQKNALLPDVCLIDVSMQRMGGLELLCNIRRRWPSVKCMVLTGFDDEPKLINMILHGACAYILKNGDPEEVVAAIKAVHQYGYYYSEFADHKTFTLILNDQLRQQVFTPVETRIMQLSGTELTYHQIAEDIGISFRALDTHRERLYLKLNVNSRVGVVIAAISLGIFPIDNKQLNLNK